MVRCAARGGARGGGRGAEESQRAPDRGLSMRDVRASFALVVRARVVDGAARRPERSRVFLAVGQPAAPPFSEAASHQIGVETSSRAAADVRAAVQGWLAEASESGCAQQCWGEQLCSDAGAVWRSLSKGALAHCAPGSDIPHVRTRHTTAKVRHG
eukprot:2259293-Rhodomonas_salina.1